MKPRSPQTNRALHKLFNDIDRYCLENGITIKDVMSHMQQYDLEMTPSFVKQTWRAIQESTTGKASTTELQQDEVDDVYKNFQLFWSGVTGQNFVFPSYDAQAMEALLEEYK